MAKKRELFSEEGIATTVSGFLNYLKSLPGLKKVTVVSSESEDPKNPTVFEIMDHKGVWGYPKGEELLISSMVRYMVATGGAVIIRQESQNEVHLHGYVLGNAAIYSFQDNPVEINKV